jgi:hypothetical protein
MDGFRLDGVFAYHSPNLLLGFDCLNTEFDVSNRRMHYSVFDERNKNPISSCPYQELRSH